jgi:hypothetical protein
MQVRRGQHDAQQFWLPSRSIQSGRGFATTTSSGTSCGWSCAGHLILVMRVHLPGLDHGVMDAAPALYTIRIHGHLGTTMLFAFPALVPQHHGADTVLTGLLDRSALYAVLAEIEALGLDLVEVRQLAPRCRSPESGDSRSP